MLSSDHYQKIDYFLERFANETDEFVKCILLWLTLNILYSETDGERELPKLTRYLMERGAPVRELLVAAHDLLVEVADYLARTPIHEPLNEYLRTRRSFLNDPGHENAISDFAEFIWKIRNNLFHGGKNWEEAEEGVLLSKVNVVLRNLVETLRYI